MKKILLLFAILIAIYTNVYGQVDDRIPFNNQDLWLNGGNIAWVNFGRDVGPGTTPLQDFDAMFNQVQENGGNTMRFWVHITGGSTPAWSGNNVTSPGSGTIEDLRIILDKAWESNTSLILCLWSFDMLRTSNGTNITNRAKALLQDSTLTETYIQNALIPMVEALKDHPALLAWEIFNEPEGMSNEFGWDFTRHVPMSDIQRFVNQTAGAIHRTDSDALVSNGSWSFSALANTSKSNSKNYYSDEELITAGKDSLGVLDFYMVHYYDWGKTELSPFHNDKSSWGLNKPVVVAEFGIPSNSLFGLPKDDMYEELYNRGYAGALVWQWVDWYQSRGGGYAESWLRGLDQMKYMQEAYPSDVNILNTIPFIKSFRATPGEIENGGQSELSWEVINSVEVTLEGVIVDSVGTLVVSPTSTTEYMLIATGSEGDKDTVSITLNVLEAGLINRALNKESRSSTFETCCGKDRVSSLAFDGDDNTRWSSAWRDGTGTDPVDPNTDSNPDSEWIDVDLGKAISVGSVLLNWEEAHSSKYNLQTSFDGINWKTVYTDANANGGVDSVVFNTPISAQFVRMQGNDRSNEFGHSIWEFEVRGSVSINQPPMVQISNPENGQPISVGSNLQIQANASDSDGEIQYVSFFLDGDSLGADNTAPYTFTLLNINEGLQELYAKTVDDDGVMVQSQTVTFEGRTDIYNTRLEAEDATLKGATEVVPGASGASKGAAVKMDGSGSITWENLNLPTGEVYTLTIGYQLPFDYKEQILKINGTTVDTLAFELPTNTWLEKKVDISSQQNIESISIEHFWGYMNFDYADVTITGVTVSNERESELPTKVVLNQNYPNPFNPTTTINYSIPNASNVQLSIYNLIGQRVATLVDMRQSAGNHSIEWNASSVSSGIYFYKIVVGQNELSKKMVLIK